MRLTDFRTLIPTFATAIALVATQAVFAQDEPSAEIVVSPPATVTVAKKFNDVATEKLLNIIGKNLAPKAKAEQVRQQLKLGANPNAHNGEALEAECSYEGEDEVIVALLDAGADPSLNFGIALKQATIKGNLNAMKLILKAEKIDPHFQQEALLMYAGLRGYPDIVEYLVREHKMNPNGFDNSGKLLGNIAKAIFETWPDIDKQRYRETLRRLTKDLGADIHLNDDNAFMIVSEYGVISGAEMLLDLGADINARDGAAMRMALNSGRVEFGDMLLRRGIKVDTASIKYDLAQIEKEPDKYTKAQREIADKIAQRLKEVALKVEEGAPSTLPPPPEPTVAPAPA